MIASWISIQMFFSFQKSYQQPITAEFQKKYANIVLELDNLNKDLNEYLIGVQQYCQEVSHKMRLCMTKPAKWPVRPAKTHISLGICPVWSEYQSLRCPLEESLGP